MQSLHFFSLGLSMNISNFSKYVDTVLIKCCTVIKQPKGPLRAQWLQNRKTFFDFFRFSQKLSIRFERIFLQLFYTILETYMCNGIKIV